MSKKLFITRVRHDLHNEYLHAYSKEILDAASAEGWDAHKIDDEDAKRKNVVSRLLKNKYNLAVFNGHGERDIACGHNDEVLLSAKEDAQLLAGAIAFFRMCDTISGLGKAAVEKGKAKAAVGYIESFSFYGQQGFESRPLQDPMAKPVLKVSNIIPIKLIGGSKLIDAMKASKRESRNMVRKLLEHDADQHTRLIIDKLVQNDIALNYEGDKEAVA